MKKDVKKSGRKKRKRLRAINVICWAVIPIAIIGFLLLDGLSIYTFNTERLIVLGVAVLVMLIPFFSEISVKNISFKKDDEHK